MPQLKTDAVPHTADCTTGRSKPTANTAKPRSFKWPAPPMTFRAWLCWPKWNPMRTRECAVDTSTRSPVESYSSYDIRKKVEILRVVQTYHELDLVGRHE